MRLKIFILAAVFLVAPVCLVGQENAGPKARLIRSRFGGGDVGHYTQEVALIFGDHRDDPDVRAAIRICSKDPLPLALNTAGASPFLMEQYLTEFYGYPRERILFLRSEDCLGSLPAPAITESWLVPKGAALPSSVELITSCRVSHNSIPKAPDDGEEVSTTREFMSALREFAAELKSRPAAVGIVLGGYYVEAGDNANGGRYKRPRREMGRRVREAARFLEKAGLRQGRYFRRVHPWVTNCANGCDYSEQPKFPALRVIEIKKECGPDK